MASVIPTLIIPNVEYALFIFSLQRETKLNSRLIIPSVGNWNYKPVNGRLPWRA